VPALILLNRWLFYSFREGARNQNSKKSTDQTEEMRQTWRIAAVLLLLKITHKFKILFSFTEKVPEDLVLFSNQRAASDGRFASSRFR
jgi:hypothetical protein